MLTLRDVAEHWRPTRRCTRIDLSVPLIITSLDPAVKFQGMVETLDVSSSGVRLRLSYALPPGTRVRLDIAHTDRMTEGHVVWAKPDGKYRWKVGVKLLEQTGNFWGVTAPPADWSPSRSTHR